MCDEGYIENNPCKNIKPFKTEYRRKEGLTLEQMELLRVCCETKREKALLEFLYSTGCRVSEAVKTNISDLSWNEMSLKVIGKGDKERKVYFSERAKVILKDYIASREDDCEALFGWDRGSGRLGRNSMLRDMRELGSKMEVPINVTPHLLRHTFAEHAANAGIPIQIIQQLMGHESPSTTVRYSTVDDVVIKQEYRKL